MAPPTRISKEMVTRKSSSCCPSLRLGAVALVICLVLLLTTPASTASVARSRGRFASPCSGSSSGIVETLAAVEATDAGDGDERLGLTFERLAHKTDRLRRRVKALKTLYVSERFKDRSVVRDLDQVGLKLDGMPSTHAVVVASIAQTQAVSVVHQAFDDLARVSVFVDQARLGELLAENEHVTFEGDFATIEDHHEEGLYLILCSLHTLSISLGRTVDPGTYRDILALRVTEVDRNALRHTRDYLVLRDFEKVLERVEMQLAALKRLYA